MLLLIEPLCSLLPPYVIFEVSGFYHPYDKKRLLEYLIFVIAQNLSCEENERLTQFKCIIFPHNFRDFSLVHLKTSWLFRLRCIPDDQVLAVHCSVNAAEPSLETMGYFLRVH